MLGSAFHTTYFRKGIFGVVDEEVIVVVAPFRIHLRSGMRKESTPAEMFLVIVPGSRTATEFSMPAMCVEISNSTRIKDIEHPVPFVMPDHAFPLWIGTFLSSNQKVPGILRLFQNPNKQWLQVSVLNPISKVVARGIGERGCVRICLLVERENPECATRLSEKDKKSKNMYLFRADFAAHEIGKLIQFLRRRWMVSFPI